MAVLALAAGNGTPLTAVVGESVTAEGVTVQAVVTDEGFWVGPDVDQRVFVRLQVQGESDVEITTGQSVNFQGLVTAVPGGFVDEIGLSQEEGAGLLISQGAYVQVEPANLEIVDQAE